ncbi:MAG: 3-methyl-2-oxobutanoate hydroxymethyltransferase [Candidatus Cloacimonadaceae bacterium]|jgi:3-methyl-2-oxobutanoate hydroxymethyltransferase|nr:3-methyl-2-oxobutanoate hydroxymethyltransferase [Candidatus Cloacimonadota bacterium]MDD5624594.1 3-methyl-2-oxobutanoate hydroxymethyltransferase [Candidatus Cloacimonadota bacterium]MDY0111476.1 3-methyl-2-oxobutanoate hydroxymethyltransferase [Candidatus Syntrophosphaera sp.]
MNETVINKYTSNHFKKMKSEGKKICMVTAYDYAMARCVQTSDIDLILVGDSLGMVVLGYENTLSVTIEDMIHHTTAVRRGAPNSFIISDMPYMSYHLNLEQTKINAAKLIVEGGADAVKLEGGSESRLAAISAILDCQIPVCAHIGLTPQSIRIFGGYKVQGKTPQAYSRLLKQAVALEETGAFMLVLEGVPEALGKDIANTLNIPVIGIGAGRFVDGQVLVINDLLGYSDIVPKFVKIYASLDKVIVDALNQYCAEVREKVFPDENNVYYPINKEE